MLLLVIVPSSASLRPFLQEEGTRFDGEYYNIFLPQFFWGESFGKILIIYEILIQCKKEELISCASHIWMMLSVQFWCCLCCGLSINMQYIHVTCPRTQTHELVNPWHFKHSVLKDCRHLMKPLKVICL